FGLANRYWSGHEVRTGLPRAKVGGDLGADCGVDGGFVARIDKSQMVGLIRQAIDGAHSWALGIGGQRCKVESILDEVAQPVGVRVRIRSGDGIVGQLDWREMGKLPL